MQQANMKCIWVTIYSDMKEYMKHWLHWSVRLFLGKELVIFLTYNLFRQILNNEIVFLRSESIISIDFFSISHTILPYMIWYLIKLQEIREYPNLAVSHSQQKPLLDPALFLSSLSIERGNEPQEARFMGSGHKEISDNTAEHQPTRAPCTVNVTRRTTSTAARAEPRETHGEQGVLLHGVPAGWWCGRARQPAKTMRRWGRRPFFGSWRIEKKRNQEKHLKWRIHKFKKLKNS